MPQPFENFSMDALSKFTKDDFFKAAQKPGMPPNEILNTIKVADLAHFLVHNYKSELTSSEHVVDTAIRLLSTIR